NSSWLPVSSFVFLQWHNPDEKTNRDNSLWPPQNVPLKKQQPAWHFRSDDASSAQVFSFPESINKHQRDCYFLPKFCTQVELFYPFPLLLSLLKRPPPQNRVH